jgi:F-type H+-transporting ATPase subunit delta
MTELATMARPYALAVFKRAKETGAVESWSDVLAFLAVALEEPAMKSAIANPRLEKKRLVELLTGLCEGPVGAECANLLKVLAANSRLSLVREIKTLFDAYRAEDEASVDADVATAYPLSEAEERSLAETLQKTLKRKVRLRISEDRELIGGLLVRAGDKVIDASVRGQLQRLANRI